MLKAEVKDLKEYPVTLVFDESPEFFDLSDEEFQFFGRAKGEITFQLVNNDVLATGEVDADARSRCVRCLEPAEVHVKAKVSLIYSPHPTHKDEMGEVDVQKDIVNYYDGKAVYPKEQIRELVLLELPHFPYCREDCRGLCPQCGKNLNVEECACGKAQESSAAVEVSDWKAKLKRFKKEIETSPGKPND